jgi:hypothetical protein
LTIAGVELGVDPLHPAEIQVNHNNFRHELARRLLDHQVMREKLVIEAVGTGHAAAIPGTHATACSDRQSSTFPIPPQPDNLSQVGGILSLRGMCQPPS